MPLDGGGENYCRHGRPECDCLDGPDDETRRAIDAYDESVGATTISFPMQANATVHVVTGAAGGGGGSGRLGPKETGVDFDTLYQTVTGNSSGTSLGGTWGAGGAVSTTGPLLGTSVAPATSHPLLNPTPPTFGCAELGHVIPNERDAICTDEEGVVVGICSVCMQTVRFPNGIKAFDFERAGVMLGRCIAVDSDDDAKVGMLLDSLTELEREMENQVRRFDAAQDLLNLARSVLKKRALRDAASAVDPV